jgi:hypothetical protein
MLKDLTLDIWVPSLRWMVAHRMQRKMPNYNMSSSALGRAYLEQAQNGAWFESGWRKSADNVHSMMPNLRRNGASATTSEGHTK